jgi:protein phosphatase
LLQEQMDAGLITREQAATSSNKNLVTRALGVEDAVLLEVNEHKVEPGDIFLLCSDGLSDMVDDQEIANILGSDVPLEQRVAQLIDVANANGGRDNISVLAAMAHTGAKKRGLISRLLGK